MTKKWKEFLAITGGSAGLVSAELGWTAFLVWSSSKIPVIGIPIAVGLGLTGLGCATFFGNAGRFACQDWYKEYYTK